MSKKFDSLLNNNDIRKGEVIASPREALLKQLEAPELDPIVLGVANDYLAGQNIHEIADNYNVSPDVVSMTLEKKEVKAYIDNVYLNQGFMSRFKRINLINKIIQEKMEEALETGVLSKKDIFDYLKLLNDMEKEAKPKEKVGVAIQVNNNYENLMQELMKN